MGQFNTKSMQDAVRGRTLHPNVVKTITTKAYILKEGVQTATIKMLSYYPPQLQRELTVGYAAQDNIGRNSYSNDIFIWISMTIFRHYVGQNVASDLTHGAEDMGYAFMSKIMGGGNAYLIKPDLEAFYSHFPMTGKGKSVVESWLMETKEYVKKWAAHFFENKSMLDVKTHPSSYFTNVNVGYGDFPF